MATQRKFHPVARPLEALEAEKIRYLLIGLPAAIVQGVMETTLDVDVWVDLPARQSMRVQNPARFVGCMPAANTVVYAPDGTPLNYVLEVSGLGPFGRELNHARRPGFQGKKIPVLKLERILQSKPTIRRDKDLAHIVQIRNLLRRRRSLAKKRSSGR